MLGFQLGTKIPKFNLVVFTKLGLSFVDALLAVMLNGNQGATTCFEDSLEKHRPMCSLELVRSTFHSHTHRNIAREVFLHGATLEFLFGRGSRIYNAGNWPPSKNGVQRDPRMDPQKGSPASFRWMGPTTPLVLASD